VGLDRQTHLGAGRPIKHPRWNLQPTVRVGCSQVAAKDNTARPLNCLTNADPQAGPWMPRIQQLPKLGTVGVLKPCCTTRSGPAPQSDTSHQHQGVRACIRRVAGCATPTGSAGHAGATANLKLTFHLGHSAGTEQITMSPPKSYRPSSNCSSSRRDTTSPYTYVIAQDGKPDPFHSTAGP
jgi:hypothetical protein